jgi:glycosyltransferase involved in cell wall biosynthesis
MNRIISDAPLREVMGRAGKQYVAQEYSWPVVLKRFYSVVDQIFAERETRKGELDEPYQL